MAGSPPELNGSRVWAVAREFTGNPNTDLSSSQFAVEDQLKTSNIVSEAHALGMKLYLGFYLGNYYNTATPLADWFNDSAWMNTVLPSVSGLAGAAHLLGFDGISMDGELYAEEGTSRRQHGRGITLVTPTLSPKPRRGHAPGAAADGHDLGSLPEGADRRL